MFEDKHTENRPTMYEIKIQGHLDVQWSEWFYGMTITREHDGGTVLCGPLPDQTILHSVLTRIRDMNLQLVSVNQVLSDGKEKFDMKNTASQKNEVYKEKGNE